MSTRRAFGLTLTLVLLAAPLVEEGADAYTGMDAYEAGLLAILYIVGGGLLSALAIGVLWFAYRVMRWPLLHIFGFLIVVLIILLLVFAVNSAASSGWWGQHTMRLVGAAVVLMLGLILLYRRGSASAPDNHTPARGEP